MCVFLYMVITRLLVVGFVILRFVVYVCVVVVVCCLLWVGGRLVCGLSWWAVLMFVIRVLCVWVVWVLGVRL